MTTSEALEALTDAGQFELLGTRVLRELESDCKAIAHFGVNAGGKTIRNPIDGFCLVPGSVPPRYVMTAFTTTEAKELERKWLWDGGGKTPSGDLIKAAERANDIRISEVDAQFIVYLVANRLLNPDLMQNCYQKAAQLGLEVRFLELSRLRDFLDTKPEGHWLRQEHLGIEAEQLSASLLGQLSKNNVREYSQEMLLVPSDEIVPTRAARTAWDAVQTSSKILHFLVGPSGSGKTVTCHMLLSQQLSSGGAGLWVPAEVAERAISLAEVIELVLQSQRPTLSAGAGHVALRLADPKRGLLIVIDDINRSGQPSRLVSKLLGWGRLLAAPGEQSKTSPAHIRLVCPVWKCHGSALDNHDAETTWRGELVIGPLLRPEAVECLRIALGPRGDSYTALEIDRFAQELHDDAILLGLFGRLGRERTDLDLRLLANDVIGHFIRLTIEELATSSGMPPQEYAIAIHLTAGEMIRRKILLPAWTQVRTWITDSRSFDALTRLAAQGNLCRLASRNGVDVFEFRHDRILEHQLRIAVGDMLRSGEMNPLIDPYFMPHLAWAVGHSAQPEPILDWVETNLPAALVAAVETLPSAASPYRANLLARAKRWLSQPPASMPEAHRDDALDLLSSMQTPDVLEITENLPMDRRIWAARLRNGDALSGARFLSDEFYPAVNYSWLESLIQQAAAIHGERLINQLDPLLRSKELDAGVLFGALCLAGYLGSSELAPAIKLAWESSQDRSGDLLMAALWAGFRCASENPEDVLFPLMEALRVVSDDHENHHQSERGSLIERLTFTARHGMDESVLRYLVRLGSRTEYRSIVTMLLGRTDHPLAIEHIVSQLAEVAFTAHQQGGFSPWATIWRQQWERHGFEVRRLSKPSIERLRSLWSNVSFR